VGEERWEQLLGIMGCTDSELSVAVVGGVAS
jgi:hypothetical protein